MKASKGRLRRIAVAQHNAYIARLRKAQNGAEKRDKKLFGFLLESALRARDSIKS